MPSRVAHALPGLPSLPAVVAPRGAVADQDLVLVAGARAAAVHALLSAVLRVRQRLPHTPRDTYLVVTGRQAATAGRVEAEGSAAGRALPPALTRPRAPRRLEISVPDPLLDRVTVVAVRAVTRDDAAHHRLVRDLVDLSGCVVLVTDGRYPYQPPELDLLRMAGDHGRAILLASTHVDESDTWPDVVRANQAILASDFPDLALRPWYPVTRVRSGVADLRQEILAWSGARHRPVSPRRPPPVRLPATAGESGWRDVLDRRLEEARRAVAQCVERDVARLREVTSDPRCDPLGLGQRLEHGLQGLSVQVAAEIRLAVDDVLDAVFTRLLGAPPDLDTLVRVRAALRRDLAEESPYLALRVTGTAAVAVAPSTTPVGSLAAVDEAVHVLPPLGIALTANCLPMLAVPRADGRSRARAWVARAVDAVESGLTRELAVQFTDLRDATIDLITEGLDHDLLLI